MLWKVGLKFTNLPDCSATACQSDTAINLPILLFSNLLELQLNNMPELQCTTLLINNKA